MFSTFTYVVLLIEVSNQNSNEKCQVECDLFAGPKMAELRGTSFIVKLRRVLRTTLLHLQDGRGHVMALGPLICEEGDQDIDLGSCMRPSRPRLV